MKPLEWAVRTAKKISHDGATTSGDGRPLDGPRGSAPRPCSICSNGSVILVAPGLVLERWPDGRAGVLYESAGNGV
jgi:hypothetical protein